jgi:hypothetical protein
MTLHYSEFAEIKTTRHDNPLGGEPTFSFEWVGSSHAPVRITDYFKPFLNDSNFPFKLEAIDRNFSNGVTLYRRTNVPINLRLIQFLEFRWLKHCKAFDGLQARIILALHVWGLAYVPDWEAPSWSCVGRRR